jgi:1,4-alpha-glucan branching enzyme
MALKKEFVKSRDKCKVTFQLPAKATNGGKKVKVVGDFNDWSWETGLSMKKKGDAYVAKMEFPIGGYYQYRYMIDGQDWENDWDADGYVDTPYGSENSVVSTSMEG